MWLVFAGRLKEQFVKAMGEYSKKEIKGYEMVEDFKENVKEEGVTCVSIIDAGLHSLREWGVVHSLSKKYEGVPVVLYVRNKDMIPDQSIFSSNVHLKYVGDDLYISTLVKEMEERELESRKVLEGEGDE